MSVTMEGISSEIFQSVANNERQGDQYQTVFFKGNNKQS